MSDYEILCAPYFPAHELKDLEDAAAAAHVSIQKFVRQAVSHFARVCVPTHGADQQTDDDGAKISVD